VRPRARGPREKREGGTRRSYVPFLDPADTKGGGNAKHSLIKRFAGRGVFGYRS